MDRSEYKGEGACLSNNIEPQCTTSKLKEDAQCSEAKEVNYITTFHAVLVSCFFKSHNFLSPGSHFPLINQFSFFKVSDDKERSGYAYEGEGACLNPGGASSEVSKEAYTPNPPIASQKRVTTTISKKQQTAKKIATLVKNPSAMKTKLESSSMKTKAQLTSSSRNGNAGNPHLSQENQAIKRQKLEGGRTRQVTVTFFVLF